MEKSGTTFVEMRQRLVQAAVVVPGMPPVKRAAVRFEFVASQVETIQIA